MAAYDFEQRPKIETTPIRWRILDEFHPKYGSISGGIEVRQVRQHEGPPRYGIYLRDIFALSKTGEWDLEPMPSSREDDYLASHRWDNFDEAIQAARDVARRCLDSNLPNLAP